MQSSTRQPHYKDTQGSSDGSNEKLRSTCDSCASSKVRCAKQKPSCRRCESLKLECVYGPTRRKGKPRSKPTVDPDRQPSGCITPQDFPSSAPQSYTWCAPDLSDSFAGFPAIADSNDVLTNDFLDSTLWSPYDPQPAMESQEGVKSSTFDSTSEFDLNMTSEMQTGALSLLERTPAIPYLADVPVDHHADGHLCISMASTALKELYQLPLGHQSINSLQVDAANPSSDHILQTNRIAVQRLDQLLSCDCIPCSNDSNLPFLLATIGSKVLCWYRAVYVSTIVQPSSATRNPHSEKAVSITPITIGDFKLDRIAETRMKAQLLLCELQNLGRVFDVLAQRNKGRSNNMGSTERGVYEAFDQYLRLSLDDLVVKLNSCCVSRY